MVFININDPQLSVAPCDREPIRLILSIHSHGWLRHIHYCTYELVVVFPVVDFSFVASASSRHYQVSVGLRELGPVDETTIKSRLGGFVVEGLDELTSP